MKDMLLSYLRVNNLNLEMQGFTPEGALPEILDGLGKTYAKEGVWK